MMTTTKKSRAREVAEMFEAAGDDGSQYICAPPAPSTTSHPCYSISYYSDQSILILARGENPLVLDEERTYYRETVEHLARCLGMMTQTERSEIVQRSPDYKPTHDSAWIANILWNGDGSFGGLD